MKHIKAVGSGCSVDVLGSWAALLLQPVRTRERECALCVRTCVCVRVWAGGWVAGWLAGWAGGRAGGRGWVCVCVCVCVWQEHALFEELEGSRCTITSLDVNGCGLSCCAEHPRRSMQP